MVEWIQGHLEAIYGIRCQYRAEEFLLDVACAKALGATGRSSEELLVKEEAGELFVGLYLATELLQKLANSQPWCAQSVLEADLSAYCQVAEGVSHFIYLLRCAGQG